jgi:hypothetical protein
VCTNVVLNDFLTDMNYKFDAQYFAITDNSILLLRNRYAYREIKPQEIKKIELTKGTDVKRPTMSMIFGGLLIIASLYLIANFSGFSTNDMTGGRSASRTFAYMIIMEFFFFGLVIYSIYRALPFHSVLKLTMTSGETESLAIQELIENKMTDSLLTSLKEIATDKTIIVDRKIGI